MLTDPQLVLLTTLHNTKNRPLILRWTHPLAQRTKQANAA